MNLAEMQKWQHQVVVIKLEGFRIPMKVWDVKESYGKLRLLCRPLSGEGESWVEESRIISIIPDISVEIRDSITER